MLPGLTAAFAAAVLFGAAAIAQAIASRRVSATRHLDVTLLVQLLRQRTFLLAVGLTLAGFGLHFVALRRLPLFLAQGVVSSSVAVTALLAVTMLGTRLGGLDWAAVAAVCVGLGLLAASAGPLGTGTPSDLLPVFLLLGVAAIALATLPVLELPGTWAAALLGLLGGTAFGVVGIAARLIPDLSPATLAGEMETYAVLSAGPLAFLVYSVALQRGSVTTVSAAVVLTQTAVPSLVGVLLLGDSVRPGWTLAAVAGFVLAAGGCSELARYENLATRRDDPRELLESGLGDGVSP